MKPKDHWRHQRGNKNLGTNGNENNSKSMEFSKKKVLRGTFIVIQA